MATLDPVAISHNFRSVSLSNGISCVINARYKKPFIIQIITHKVLRVFEIQFPTKTGVGLLNSFLFVVFSLVVEIILRKIISFSEPTKAAPLSNQVSVRVPRLAVKHSIPLTQELVSIDGTTSIKQIARVVIHTKIKPFCGSSKKTQNSLLQNW